MTHVININIYIKRKKLNLILKLFSLYSKMNGAPVHGKRLVVNFHRKRAPKSQHQVISVLFRK